MNENIDLTKVLKNCPGNTKLYSSIYGEVLFRNVNENNVDYPIIVYSSFYDLVITFTREGHYVNALNGECTLFPSKEQRDWNKFTAPWYKKDIFDPKTLQPFDRVLVKYYYKSRWECGLFSSYDPNCNNFRFKCIGCCYDVCIPYNDETKHLLGTTEEAPEHYKYWN